MTVPQPAGCTLSAARLSLTRRRPGLRTRVCASPRKRLVRDFTSRFRPSSAEFSRIQCLAQGWMVCVLMRTYRHNWLSHSEI